MRSVLLATLLLTVATPALAADRPSKSTRDVQQMADTLNDPHVQRAMVGGLDTMLSALLDLRIDGVVKALEPLNGGHKIKMRGQTLRDVARGEDRDFESKMRGGTRMLVTSFGALTSALATAMPELEDAAKKMEEAVGDVERKLPKTR
jgi:hypothetical protein